MPGVRAAALGKIGGPARGGSAWAGTDYSARVDRDATIATLRDLLLPHADEVVAAYVFGSVARGTSEARSDLDLGILLKEDPAQGLAGLRFDLAGELEQSLKLPVDLVVMNQASADLVHRILREGVPVLETDRRARVAFEVWSRGQYFDLAPLRRSYRHRNAARDDE